MTGTGNDNNKSGFKIIDIQTQIQLTRFLTGEAFFRKTVVCRYSLPLTATMWQNLIIKGSANFISHQPTEQICFSFNMHT